MPDHHLHIISFDVPYPANYGGVIDVFHKIRMLHAEGVKIHLHCYLYNRDKAPELEKYCTEVHYYKRKTNWLSALTWLPYIVFSRRSDELLQNLCKDDYPILFEGLHTCYYLSHPALKDRFRIYRESNIEHQYYYHLSKAEKNIGKKLFFLLSGMKLRLFQQKLSHASLMLTVSKEDHAYLSAKFPGVRTEYLPSFHPDDEVAIEAGRGDFILYHGNLSVAENIRAAEYLAGKVFGGSGLDMVIAGMNPSERLMVEVAGYPNIRVLPNPTEEEMTRLLRTAQINVLVTFQPTGLKLKLLHALFRGRYCLVNSAMVTGTELETVCEIADDPEEMASKAAELMKRAFPEDLIRQRKEVLMNLHSNRKNSLALIKLLPVQ